MTIVASLCVLIGLDAAFSVPPAGAASKQSATKLLAQSLSAAGSAGSMHFVDNTSVNKQKQTLEGVVSAPTAGETISGNGAPLEVELIAGQIYVEGSATALTSALAISSTQATAGANKWIVVKQSDAPFQLLANDLTLSSTLSQFTPQTKGLRIGKTQKLGKVRAIPLVGTPSSLPGGTSGSVALLVSTKAPHLPIGGTLILVNKTGRLTEVVVFTSWGAKVNLTPPTGGIPFSSLL
jgi:hypothetical protein